MSKEPKAIRQSRIAHADGLVSLLDVFERLDVPVAVGHVELLTSAFRVVLRANHGRNFAVPVAIDVVLPRALGILQAANGPLRRDDVRGGSGIKSKEHRMSKEPKAIRQSRIAHADGL